MQILPPTQRFSGRATRLSPKYGRPHPEAKKIAALFREGRSKKSITYEFKTSGERINATLLSQGIDITAIQRYDGPERPHLPLTIPDELVKTLPDIRLLPRVAQKELIRMHSNGSTNDELNKAFDEFYKPNNVEAYKRITGLVKP